MLGALNLVERVVDSERLEHKRNLASQAVTVASVLGEESSLGFLGGKEHRFEEGDLKIVKTYTPGRFWGSGMVFPFGTINVMYGGKSVLSQEHGFGPSVIGYVEGEAWENLLADYFARASDQSSQ